MTKSVIRESVYLYNGREIEIRRIKFLKNWSMLTLQCPKRGFHYHHWFDEKTGRIRGHIKNEATGKREGTNKKPNKIRDEIIYRYLEI